MAYSFLESVVVLTDWSYTYLYGVAIDMTNHS